MWRQGLRVNFTNSRQHTKITSVLEVVEFVNNAILKIREINLKNPRTFLAHRSKLRIAKKFGVKDIDPLFQLPRLPVSLMESLQNILWEIDLPVKPVKDVVDEFHSSVILNHRWQDQASCTGSKYSSKLAQYS